MPPARRPATRKKSRAPRATSLARRADKHDLYQRSVQAPEHDLHFIERACQRHSGKSPRRLREDFCGTALVSSHFVASDPRREAWGVDLDPAPLAWGDEHIRQPLGKAAKRLHLIQGNVLDAETPRCDVVLAGNFSFFTLQDRPTLLAYFRHVRQSLHRGGLFMADVLGGPESMMVMTERRRVGGFTYEWEHQYFDPIASRLQAHITFRFRDGSALHRAFSYDWRVWSLPELRDVLAEAGFRETHVYWEITGKNGVGSGVLRLASKASACLSFIACLVAKA